MPPPPSATPLPVFPLLLRILTFGFLVVSLVILTTNTATLPTGSPDVEVKLRFKDIRAYRYMLAAIVIGMAYTLLQIAFTVYHVSMGARLTSGDGLYRFDFYGDKVVSYVLATGSAAGFGASIDMKVAFSGWDVDKFFNKGSAAASLLLLAFLFTAVASILSSLALPKRPS